MSLYPLASPVAAPMASATMNLQLEQHTRSHDSRQRSRMSSSTPLGCPTNPTVSLVTQPVGKHDAQEHIVLPPSEKKRQCICEWCRSSHIVLLEACRKAFQATFVALPPHRAQMFLMGLQMAFPTTAKSCAEGSITLLPLSSTTPAVAFQTCSHPLEILLAPLSPQCQW